MRTPCLLASLATLACAPSLGLSSDTEADAGTTGDTGGPSCSVVAGQSGPRLSCDQIQLRLDRDVDILFVVDNSGSMAEEQAKLAQNIGSFVDVLESREVDANYRIGVTTTDNGHLWCMGTTPEGGSLVYSSCLDRIAQFTNQQGTANVEDLACRDTCARTNADLGIDPESQPWLARDVGINNLPGGIGSTEALQCLLPQGINGCGFEAHLESMFKTLVRTDTNGDPSAGFMRENAVLAIIHMTDEADCSYNTDWTSIFEQSGNRVFWADPAAPFPTSAVCWNAGTSCTGDPSNYDCSAQSYDIDGGPIDADDPNVQNLAVLHPLSRYVDRVQDIENGKKEISPGREVIVGLIGGVGDSGVPVYADSADQTFMTDFGIGPGCSGPAEGPTPCQSNADCTGLGSQTCGPNGRCVQNQIAVPPVRLAGFVDAFSESNMYSVCSDDYSVALDSLARDIAGQFRPACYGECVSDGDPTTGVLEPTCTLEARDAEGSRPIAECAKDPASGEYLVDPATGRYQMPDVDTVVCFAMLVDPDGNVTPDTLDDMSSECVDEGFNLEFRLARSPGFPHPPGTAITADCELSDVPQIDCPGL